jgi:hypothetical protein
MIARLRLPALVILLLLLAACRQAAPAAPESRLSGVTEAPTPAPTATRPSAAPSSAGLFGAGVNLPQPTVTPLPTHAAPAGALVAPAAAELARINRYGALTPAGWSRYVDADGLLLTDGASFVVVRAWSGALPGIDDWASYLPQGRPESGSNFRAGIAGREWRGLFVREMRDGQQTGQALYAVSDAGLTGLTLLAYVPRSPQVDFDGSWRTVNAILHSLALE